jgi:hypothetical protein
MFNSTLLRRFLYFCANFRKVLTQTTLIEIKSEFLSFGKLFLTLGVRVWNYD